MKKTLEQNSFPPMWKFHPQPKTITALDNVKKSALHK